jgi:hypothetical protein
MKQGVDGNVTMVKKVRAAASGKAQIFTQSRNCSGLFVFNWQAV